LSLSLANLRLSHSLESLAGEPSLEFRARGVRVVPSFQKGGVRGGSCNQTYYYCSLLLYAPRFGRGWGRARAISTRLT
jgi:hypothetical protein